MDDIDDEQRCHWCVSYSADDPMSGRYLVEVRNCCTGVIDNFLLCEPHWQILRDQPLPAVCASCGDTAHDVTDIVQSVTPMGAYQRSELSPTTAMRAAPPDVMDALMDAPWGPPTALRTLHPASVAATALLDLDAEFDGAVDPVHFDEEADRTVSYVDDIDYLDMAENEWLRQREQQMWEADERDYGQAITQLSAQLEHARVRADQPAVQMLTMQLTQWQHRRALAAHQSADALLRDRHAFSLWRQTADGQYFVDWVHRAFTITTWIASADERWCAAWHQLESSITEPERTAYATNLWVPRPRRYHWLRGLRDIAAVLIVTGIVLSVLLNPIWCALAIGAAVACLYAVIAARDTSWEQRNTAVAAHAKRAREQRFGFDPLDDPARKPSWATMPDPFGYAADLQEIAVDAFVSHPRPDALPEPVYPTLADPSQVPADLRAVLRSLA